MTNHMRIMDYTPDPLYKTAALPRILTLRRLQTRAAMTPREQKELVRLEATQRDTEYDWHRRQRQALQRRLHVARQRSRSE